ncbi:F-box domain-containing protein [Apiospora arundinis]|uniref:F-box domain-containing protein n=1 Tax=Apiospora arundinis TaxID=335852 RepID=A0ABR2HT00_9PEZI
MPPKVRFEEAKTVQTSHGKSSNMMKIVPNKRLRSSKGTAAQPPAMTRQAVLSNWELVELILEYVDDVRDLLFFQRVSATWRDVIRSSVRLQERLFFRPAMPTDKDKGTWRRSGEETGTIELNHLLTRAFPHFFQWNKELILLEEEAEHEGVPSRNGRHSSSSSNNSGDNNSNRKRKKKKNRAVAALTRRDVSWRDMLVSQPPPNRLKYGPVVVARSSSNKGHAHDRSNPDPALRMGDLYDLAHYARASSRGFLDVCVWKNSWVREQTASSCSSSSASSKERGGIGIVRSGGQRVPEDKQESPELPAPYPCQYVGASNFVCAVMDNYSECGCWSLSHRFGRRERLVYKAAKMCNRKERCARYRCEEYNQAAVTEPLTQLGTGLADVEYHARKGRYKSVSAV